MDDDDDDDDDADDVDDADADADDDADDGCSVRRLVTKTNVALELVIHRGGFAYALLW